MGQGKWYLGLAEEMEKKNETMAGRPRGGPHVKSGRGPEKKKTGRRVSRLSRRKEPLSRLQGERGRRKEEGGKRCSAHALEHRKGRVSHVNISGASMNDGQNENGRTTRQASIMASFGEKNREEGQTIHLENARRKRIIKFRGGEGIPPG